MAGKECEEGGIIGCVVFGIRFQTHNGDLLFNVLHLVICESVEGGVEIGDAVNNS